MDSKSTLLYLRKRVQTIRQRYPWSHPEIREIMDCMMELTDGMVDHNEEIEEDWDYPCMCDLCKSYA